jgi:hypothetical protein
LAVENEETPLEAATGEIFSQFELRFKLKPKISQMFSSTFMPFHASPCVTVLPRPAIERPHDVLLPLLDWSMGAHRRTST